MSQSNIKTNVQNEEQIETKVENADLDDQHETHESEKDKMEKKEPVQEEFTICLESSSNLDEEDKEIVLPKYSAHDIRLTERVLMETKGTPSGSSILLEIFNYNVDGIEENNEGEVFPKYFPRRPIMKKPPEYWTQFNFAGGKEIPGGGGAPLDYEPSRNGFLIVVFSILVLMLVLTAGFVFFVYNDEDMNEFFQENSLIILIIGGGGLLAMSYAMACSSCTRSPPCNFICLFLALIFMSLVTACITARYDTDLIFLALISTIAVVILCMVLACTPFDFTSYILYVVAIAMAFFVVSLIITIMMYPLGKEFRTLRIVMLILGTLLSVVILVIQLQTILGGKSVELSEDDYALAAYMLYTSIVDIFLRLLMLLGIFDDE